MASASAPPIAVAPTRDKRGGRGGRGGGHQTQLVHDWAVLVVLRVSHCAGSRSISATGPSGLDRSGPALVHAGTLGPERGQPAWRGRAISPGISRFLPGRFPTFVVVSGAIGAAESERGGHRRTRRRPRYQPDRAPRGEDGQRFGGPSHGGGTGSGSGPAGSARQHDHILAAYPGGIMTSIRQSTDHPARSVRFPTRSVTNSPPG